MKCDDDNSDDIVEIILIRHEDRYRIGLIDCPLIPKGMVGTFGGLIKKITHSNIDIQKCVLFASFKNITNNISLHNVE
jgi:hypothetical protein